MSGISTIAAAIYIFSRGKTRHFTDWTPGSPEKYYAPRPSSRDSVKKKRKLRILMNFFGVEFPQFSILGKWD
jgi:hypothetical protein